jgi:hypothetical protein
MTNHTDATLLAANIAFIEAAANAPVPAGMRQYIADRFMAVLLEGISLAVRDDDPLWISLLAEYKDKFPATLGDNPPPATALSRMSYQMDHLAERSNVYGV